MIDSYVKEGADILIATPGTLQDQINKNLINLSKIETFILDEADEMLKLGFIEPIDYIYQSVLKDLKKNDKPKPQILLFSATISDEVKSFIDEYFEEEKVFINFVKKNDDKIP